MKTYKNIFEPAVTVENVKACIVESSKNGKKKRKHVRDVLEHLDQEAEIVSAGMKNRTIEVEKYEMVEITEGLKRKKRKIAKPHYKYNQIIQYVLISQIKPIVMHSLYQYAHGSLENRGPLQSMQAIQEWIRNDPKGTRYCLQMDVHHCYQTVDQDILSGMYHKKIKDDNFHYWNDKVIRASPEGLAPGAPTSIWHIHFLFTPFDHWLAQQDGVAHSLRHMDDLVIFGPNKRKLHKVERDVIEYMHRKYNMEINHNHQVFPIEWTDKNGKKHGRPLDVCGYQFYRDKTVMRENHYLKTVRKANKIGKSDKITHYAAGQMLSHLGWFKHADMYGAYLDHVKPKVNIKQLKKIVSKHTRRENQKNGMEKSSRIHQTTGSGNRENDRIHPEEYHGNGRQ